MAGRREDRSPRLPVLALWAAVHLVAGCGGGTPDETGPPNILLILADDLGYECLGVNGSLDYATPNLDRLAGDGLRFEHCYAQPLCTPSRVKLMTGLSNKRNYVRFGRLDRGQTTFAQLLGGAGYRTCIAGKWQLGSEPDSPQHFGFEESLLWQHTRGRVDAQQHDTRYANPRLERNGEPIDYRGGEYSSALFVDFLSEFMGRESDRPFLAYYSMNLVHCPFGPTPDSKDWDPEDHGSTDYKGSPQHFDDMVSYLDKSVGRLIERLDALGIREDTLVIFTSDNGTDTPIVTRTSSGDVAGAKKQTNRCGHARSLHRQLAVEDP